MLIDQIVAAIAIETVVAAGEQVKLNESECIPQLGLTQIV